MTEDSITLNDFQLWEDELIYTEIEDGLTPWVFNSDQQQVTL
jgi:hypothetical protein